MPFELNELKKLRRNLGLTQKQLANRANVSQSLIAKIESSRLDPAYSKAQKIFEVLTTLQNNTLRAESILNKNIISVSPKDSLKTAIKKMKKYNISQMPVIDKQPVGLVSETVLLEALINSKQPNTQISEVMKDAPPIVTKQASLSIITQLLREYPIILVSFKGKLIGHITKSDVITKTYQ